MRSHRAGILVVALMLAASVLGAPARAPGLSAASSGEAATAARAAARPNIVLILTDDQALSDMRWLPKTRRLLGGEGVTFRHFLAAQPLCCPSRAQLLSGQYAHNNGVRENSGTHGGYQHFRPATALPVWLHRAGYRTGFVGKYMNGYGADDGVEVGWDSWNPTVVNTYTYFGFTQYDNGTLVDLPESVYHTDYVAAETRQLITRYAAQSRPFFIWSSYVAPHGTCWMTLDRTCSAPPRPAVKYANSYPDVRAPSLDVPSFNEADVSDKPRWVTRKGKVDPAAIQRLFTQRIRVLASVDDAVADTVAALREAGVLDNTLILFTADNGYLLGQHRFVGKIVAYEESVRVPLLMRGPGIPAGAVRQQTAAMIDIAPTLAAVAGARPLVRVDGRNIMGYARFNQPQRDRTVLVQAGARGGVPPNRDGWLFRGVRTKRYTYVHWTATNRTELYDRHRDPYQLRSVAKSRRYQAIRAALAWRTRALGHCSGPSCRVRFARLPWPDARG